MTRRRRGSIEESPGKEVLRIIIYLGQIDNIGMREGEVEIGVLHKIENKTTEENMILDSKKRKKKKFILIFKRKT